MAAGTLGEGVPGTGGGSRGSGVRVQRWGGEWLPPVTARWWELEARGEGLGDGDRWRCGGSGPGYGPRGWLSLSEMSSAEGGG